MVVYGVKRRYDGSPAGIAKRKRAAQVKRRNAQFKSTGYNRNVGFYGRFGPAGELKFRDTALTPIGAVANTMESINLNVIPQGNTEKERIGRKVTVKRIDVRGIIELPSTTLAVETTDELLMMIVVDKQTNGTTFTGSQLWENNIFPSFMNLANQQRFQILATKYISMESQASDSTVGFGAITEYFHMGVSCNIPLEFDDEAITGAIATQRSNSLWFVAITHKGLQVINQTNCRIRFSDGYT